METRHPSNPSDEVIDDIVGTCMVVRTRLLSRVISGIYDLQLRPLGIGSAQFALLVVMYKLGPSTRAEIGRFNRQDRSTLSRNIKLILSLGWAEERPEMSSGRSRLLTITAAGKTMLRNAAPAWRLAQKSAAHILGDEGASSILLVADEIMASEAEL